MEPPNAYEMTQFGVPVARLTRVSWLTPSEVAARLHVCRATVYKLCETGQLAFARVGLSIRISEPGLEAFLAGRG
jgi:excisionase family DNA binding protein